MWNSSRKRPMDLSSLKQFQLRMHFHLTIENHNKNSVARQRRQIKEMRVSFYWTHKAIESTSCSIKIVTWYLGNQKFIPALDVHWSNIIIITSRTVRLRAFSLYFWSPDLCEISNILILIHLKTVVVPINNNCNALIRHLRD